MSVWLNLYSLLVSVTFVLYASLQLWDLRGSATKVVPNLQGHIKTILVLGLTITQIISLIEITNLSDDFNSQAPLFASTFATFELFILSFFEHRRTVRPSSPVTLYVALCSVKDLIALTIPSGDLRTAGLMLLSIRLVLEFSLLVVELRNKLAILKPRYKHLAPEELTGIVGRALFWWINPILKEGYHELLTQDDLPKVDRALSSRILRKRLVRAWTQRFFRYSQPTLIKIAMTFVRIDGPQHESTDSGYWLIVLTTIIYCGLAISTSVYRHKLNRLQIMARGALISLLHARSLRAASSPIHDGNALTLMSADVDSLDTSAEMLHETWAQVVEVLVGTALLGRQLGWFALLPLLIIFGCSQMSAYVAKHLQAKQKDWSVATQDRLSMLASVLRGIKSMKILGLDQATSFLVSNLRAREIAKSIRLRWIMVAYNASANALGIFSPVLTLVLFAVSRSENDAPNADIVFTSIALLGLVTHPANMVMTIVPRVIASLANFERIQSYLTQGSLKDERVFTSRPKDKPQPGPQLAFTLENVSIQLSSSHQVLQHVHLQMTEGSIGICSGPIGSGKSALALTILGEINPTEGRITISHDRIAYCSSSVWLPNASIRDVICGQSSKFDADWYQTVIQACRLVADLESLVDGDMTWVGSGGINVSGGQKSRIALARAVYSRCCTMVLDDPFSPIDAAVESQIFHALLGPEGILRKMKSTVFLITRGTQYYHLADTIILLNEGKVQVQSSSDFTLQTKPEMRTSHVLQRTSEADKSEIAVKSQRDGTQIDDAAADKLRRTGDLAVYGYYFGSAGISNMLLMATCTAIYAFCLTFAQYILKWWTESDNANSTLYILIYFLLSLMAWIATNGTMWSTHIVIAPRSGSTLHSRLLGKIMNAPLSYFSTFDIGTILNRFGQDIQLVDKEMPSAFANLSNQIFKLIMQSIVLFVAQPTIAMTLPLCTICVYFIQQTYLRTSRQLRFIDLESKEKLYTSFLETVEGIATIRGFGWEERFAINNVEKLDISQRPLYLLLCLQRWLNVVLDLLIAGIAVILIASAVIFRSTATGADMGIALNMVIAANTTLLRLVENWTTLETSLGAVSRLRSVDEDTPSEDKSWDCLEPSPEWPNMGSVKIKHVSAGYNSHVPVLREVNMDIRGGSGVILCGRTGSGKSSLLLTLLQLLRPQTGTIEVDGVDITRLPVHVVRRRCFVALPQDPFILPDASLRFNLDPYNQHQDDTILEMLSKTGLWSKASRSELRDTFLGRTTNGIVLDTTNPGFLDQPLASFAPVSTGQMQMLAFTQALLRVQSSTQNPDPVISQRKPIVLLDEASSSLDLETDIKMQEMLRDYFTNQGHTTIAISHRLNTLRKELRPGVDTTVWMADGRPEELHGFSEGILDPDLGGNHSD
ncbi:hypothetical protein CBS147355_8641 [Penicillium roqueforti]|nr:hypothetical protein CBS147355_8641 [Penicillium roqueforti]